MSAPEQPARVFLRPIASPLALGFVGLAVDTIVAAGVELDWFPPAERHKAALLILIFGPLAQLVASIFGFLARDPAAATGMGVLGATWLCIGAITLTSAPGSHDVALGAVLLVAATAVAFSSSLAAGTKGVVAAVLGCAALRFALTGIHQVSGSGGFMHAAGWVGVALCPLALYGALSSELEDDRHGPVLPTLRRGRGRQAFEPDLGVQVENVAAEAGVREQL